ncbi:DUF2790 domain-containing protein [Pseudomonas sp. NPDC086278]|uniref:DUF2790 domain-containing protein n=1 Tax=Pseudomonas sp. NPDC086278 TaxID=3390646 RepID=UPI003CFE73FE
MKTLTIALLLTLGGIAAPAFADDGDSATEASQAPVESYAYGKTLDIRTVIAVSDIANECGPVPARMTYEDSNGQRHILQYQVMGTGCSNG